MVKLRVAVRRGRLISWLQAFLICFFFLAIDSHVRSFVLQPSARRTFRYRRIHQEISMNGNGKPFSKLLSEFVQRIESAMTPIDVFSATASSGVDSTIKTNTAIIGAGISGLSCASTLQKSGFSDFLVLESGENVGGRVYTDAVDGYLLDRGFQVFIDSYPEAKSLFDYKDLQLKSFLPGAMVHFQDKFHLVSDPLRRPTDLLPSLISPIGSLPDKVKVNRNSAFDDNSHLDYILSSNDSC